MGGKPVMMIVALFLQGVTVVVLFFASEPWTFYLFGVLFGLGFGGEMSAYLVVNRQYFGTGPMATLYGYEIMGAMMGHAIATLLGGLVRELTGSYLPVFALSMGFSIVAGTCGDFDAGVYQARSSFPGLGAITARVRPDGTPLPSGGLATRGQAVNRGDARSQRRRLTTRSWSDGTTDRLDTYPGQ